MNVGGYYSSDFKRKYLNFLKKKEGRGKPILDKIGKLNTFYIPLSQWIYSVYKKDNKTKIIGLSGGQGSGKSTITSILKFILKTMYGIETCIFSIDDFYKTKKERQLMSKQSHSLFLTRGVPGTHDINLLNKTITQLKRKDFKSVLIPKFDKATDDRSKKTNWIKIKKPPHLIIFEGWCVGARHENNATLKKPINFIERTYDKDLKWRKNVNTCLRKKYKDLFNRIDKLVYLKAPSFNHILKWRMNQEKKLKITSKSKKTMSKSELERFIMFYERITKRMMKDYRKISDLTIFLDANHKSLKMSFYKK